VYISGPVLVNLTFSSFSQSIDFTIKIIVKLKSIETNKTKIRKNLHI